MSQRILLRDLKPDQDYGIRFRLVGNGQQSDWSNITRFKTTSDVVAPANVTGLSLKAIGTAFEVTWNKVVVNTDGSELKDFKDYQVAVTAGGQTRYWYTPGLRFDLPIEVNTNAFGTPQPAISVSVSARDLNMNIASNPPSLSASNAQPPAPTGLTASPTVNAVNLKWNKVNIEDLKYYRVYEGTTTNPTTLVYEGNGNSFTWQSIDFSNNHYFKVAAVDVFNQEAASSNVSSSPLAFDASDKAPPAAPTWPTSWISVETDLTNKYNALANVTLTWNANTESDLGAYIVRWKKPTDTLWSQARVQGTALAAPANTIKLYGLALNTTYNFEVAAQDKTGNTSTFTSAPASFTTTADTTPPPKPSTPTIQTYLGQLNVVWNNKSSTNGSMGTDLASVEVHASATDNFTPSSSTLQAVMPASATAGDQKTLISGLTYGVRQYFRLVAVDFANNKSNPSDIASGVPSRITATDVGPNTIITESANIGLAVIDDANIANINAAKIRTGELAAGQRIIAGPENDTHAEMTSTGFRVYGKQQDRLDAQGNTIVGLVTEVVRLGTDSNDYFAVTKADGSYAATIDDTGRGSFNDLVVEGDPTFQGRKLSAIVNSLPKGIVAYGTYQVNQNGIQTEYGLYEVSFTAEPFRAYRIYVTNTQWGHGGSVGAYAMFLLRATSPSSPGNWAELQRFWKYPEGNNFERGDNMISFIWYNPEPGLHRVVLSAYSPNQGLHAFSASQMAIEDLGPIPPNTAVQQTLGGTPNNPPPQPVVQTYTRQYPIVWSESYRGTGALMTNSGGRLYQGYESSNGNLRGLAGWDTNAVLSDLSGSVVNNVQFFLYAAHWYNNSGGTAVIGAHALDGAPGTFNGVIDPNRMQIGGWPKPGGQWFDISSWGNEIKAGSVKGIVVGPAPNNDRLYYGYFNGASYGDTRPVLQVTFTK